MRPSLLREKYRDGHGVEGKTAGKGDDISARTLKGESADITRASFRGRGYPRRKMLDTGIAAKGGGSEGKDGRRFPKGPLNSGRKLGGSNPRRKVRLLQGASFRLESGERGKPRTATGFFKSNPHLVGGTARRNVVHALRGQVVLDQNRVCLKALAGKIGISS